MPSVTVFVQDGVCPPGRTGGATPHRSGREQLTHPVPRSSRVLVLSKRSALLPWPHLYAVLRVVQPAALRWISDKTVGELIVSLVVLSSAARCPVLPFLQRVAWTSLPRLQGNMQNYDCRKPFSGRSLFTLAPRYRCCRPLCLSSLAGSQPRQVCCRLAVPGLFWFSQIGVLKPQLLIQLGDNRLSRVPESPLRTHAPLSDHGGVLLAGQCCDAPHVLLTAISPSGLLPSSSLKLSALARTLRVQAILTVHDYTNFGAQSRGLRSR